ncbi:MAG TPA: response regulator [Desulfuromonadales bacterium]|nr:response regulator [Desulfuromonadales bacterium]
MSFSDVPGTSCENHAAGLEAFQKHTPDIVVTDILMPKMDGLTLAQEILRIMPSVPIIVVAVFEQTDYLLQAINMGIEKYVTKPVNSYQLHESLLNCAHHLRTEQLMKLRVLRRESTVHFKDSLTKNAPGNNYA